MKDVTCHASRKNAFLNFVCNYFQKLNNRSIVTNLKSQKEKWRMLHY